MALNTIGEVETKPGANSRELSAHYKNAASGKNRAAYNLFLSGADDVTIEKVIADANDLTWKSRGYALKGFVQTLAARVGLNLG